MNERIKELELQAYVEVTKSWRDPSSGFVQEITGKEFSRERFAELIVRECAEIALKSGRLTNKSRIYHKIKEHFEVE